MASLIGARGIRSKQTQRAKRAAGRPNPKGRKGHFQSSQPMSITPVSRAAHIRRGDLAHMPNTSSPTNAQHGPVQPARPRGGSAIPTSSWQAGAPVGGGSIGLGGHIGECQILLCCCLGSQTKHAHRQSRMASTVIASFSDSAPHGSHLRLRSRRPAVLTMSCGVVHPTYPTAAANRRGRESTSRGADEDVGDAV